MRKFLSLLAVAAMAFPCMELYAQENPASVDTKLPMTDYNLAPKQYIINEVTVSGFKSLDPKVIASTSGINVGDTVLIPGDYITSALRKMWNQKYYSDVQVITEPVGNDRINIEIVLVERPKVLTWSIEGVISGERKELMESLQFKKGGELSDYVISSSKNAILKYMREKGFRNAVVDVVQNNDENIENAVNIIFKVTKNEKVKIGKISFEGNDNIRDGKLRRSFKKTHQKGPNLFRNTKLKEKDYEEDKGLLIEYYNSKGYRNAALLSDSIYPISSKRIGILIDVDEGDKFYFRNIAWTGNSLYETEFLNSLLGIVKGDTYDKKTMEKRLGIGANMDIEDPTTVSAQYQNKGYIFSEIDPAETVIAPDSIDLNIKIFEGNQARVNEVSITGNLSVDEDVIRRQIDIRPGELYDRSLLMSSLRELMQMTHFEPTELQPTVNPVSNDRVDVGFPLVERASDTFEVSGGWGYDMFVGSVGVQLNNVSIKNFFKKNAWTPYPKGQNQVLGIRAQTNGKYYKAVSLNFMEPWLGGKKPISLNLGLYYSSQNNASYMWQSGNSFFRTLGVSAGIGRRLKWPDRFFTIYNELAYQSYNLKDWDGFIFSNGTSNIISLKTVFGRNTVDNPIFPAGGSDFSISLALTPPYSLLDNKDYSDPNMEEHVRYKWIEYHKWLLKGEWYYALTNNSKFILMAKAEMGYIGAYNKNKPSPFEGFDVGGDGMSGYTLYGMDIVSLRGYENSSLTPITGRRNEYARAYNKYTLELRYPIILGQQTVYGLVFAEAGNAFSSWKQFDPFLLKRSAGVGIRVHLPMLGMLGFDWGYGFDKAVGSSKRSGGHPHFIMGTQF